jgi:hypothetical protein
MLHRALRTGRLVVSATPTAGAEWPLRDDLVQPVERGPELADGSRQGVEQVGHFGG